MANFVDLTAWIPVDEAKTMIKTLIEKGKYNKNQIKKSSNIFANRKDKSEGYLCRVLAEAGIHPELEIKKEKKTRKISVETKKEVAPGSQPVDNQRYVVNAEPVDEHNIICLIDCGGKFWVERQCMTTNEKTVISPVVDNEDDARWQWNKAKWALQKN